MSYPFDPITKFIFLETDELNHVDLILIPGGSHPQLMERAADLYHEGLAPLILPSGGATKHVEKTEWNYLNEIGLSLGIPQAAILKEDKATNTFENAKFSWEIIQEYRITANRVILVCKAGHACRALLTYKTVFPKETQFYLAPVIDKTGISKDNWYLTEDGIKRIMTEVEKIGKYFGHHIPNWVHNNN
ncbi:MAG: YdcF family protein [Paenibacillaceae bacterium]